MITLNRMFPDGNGKAALIAQRRAQLTEEQREALALGTERGMPKPTSPDDPIYSRFDGPYDVVKGLGLPYTDEVIWADRVRRWTDTAQSEIVLKKALVNALREDSLHETVRGEIARRALVFYRQTHRRSSLLPDQGQPVMRKAFPQPGQKPQGKPGQGPQPKKRGMPMPEQRVPNGKPKMMDHSQPGKAPKSLADAKPHEMESQLDMAGIHEEPQDPKVLKQKLMRLQDQLHSTHGDIQGSAAHKDLHNEIKQLLRELFKNPTPEGVREAEHQVAHFSALVGGAPDQDPSMMDPNDPSGGMGGGGGPQFRQVGGGAQGKPNGGPPMQKAETRRGLTLVKADGAFGGPPANPSSPTTAIARPSSGGMARHGEGSRGGHIVGHTPSGQPIYAKQHADSTPMHGEAPEDTHNRLKQHLLDVMKALHEHEQRHGLPPTFGSQHPLLDGKPPGWTSPDADTVIRGESAKPKGQLGSAPQGMPEKQGAPQLGTSGGTVAGRQKTGPAARGQSAPSKGAESNFSEPADKHADSKAIADAVMKDGHVGKTSTGKDVTLGGDVSGFNAQELNEASQLHRAAHEHLNAAAKGSGNAQYKAAARKHLDEDFRLASHFVTASSGVGDKLGPAMTKGGGLFARITLGRANLRRLDRRAPTLTKAEFKPKGRIKLSPAQQSAMEIHVEDAAHDDDEARVKMRAFVGGGYLTVHPGDDEGRAHVEKVLSDIVDSESHPESGDPDTVDAIQKLMRKVSGEETAKRSSAARQARKDAPKRAADKASTAFREAGERANASGVPLDHANAAHAADAAIEAHKAAGSPQHLLDLMAKTREKHVAAAGHIYTGPRGGTYSDPEHKHHVKKGSAGITLRKADGGEGSRGGHVIGHRPNGDPIYGSPATPRGRRPATDRPTPEQRKAALDQMKAALAARPKREWVDRLPGVPTMEEGGTAKLYGIGDDGIPKDPIRRKLHDKIIEEMLSKGKAPEPGTKPLAIVTMGGPASGKSSALKHLDTEGFVHVDPDGVKEQLPEYKRGIKMRVKEDGTVVSAKGTAAAVHEESSAIAKRARAMAIQQGKNVIIDGTGKNADTHGKLIEHLKAQGYHVHLVMPHQEKEKAIQLADARATKAGRYVPREVIDEAYEKIPRNFLPLAQKAHEATLFDASQGFPPKLVYQRHHERGDTVHDAAFMESFKGRFGDAG